METDKYKTLKKQKKRKKGEELKQAQRKIL